MEATLEKSVEKKVEPRKPVKLKTAEFERTVYVQYVEPGVTVDAVQRPEFWAHVAASLKPTDRIEIIADDFAWFAELMVIKCDRGWAKTALLRFVELTGGEVAAELLAPLSAGYKVEYKGPSKKHVVLRLSDNTIVQEGIALKADAERWIAEHVRALAR